MKKAQTAVIVVLLTLILVALIIVISLQVSDFPITGRFISLDKEYVQGNGKVISKNYDFSDFKEIEIRGKGNLFLTQGEGYSIRIVAEKNIIELLDVRVDGDKLIIGERKLFFYNNEPIDIYVSMPEVNGISISGFGDIKGENKIKSDTLEIAISGSSDIEMDLEVDKLNTKISGFSDIVYSGDAKEHLISISGSGDIKAFDLNTENTDISISGSGDLEVYATNILDIGISGSGEVDYKGSPKITQSISGAGRVKGI